ncbi:MAG: redoxin domain-containing protein [Candidatus Zixiibacteriota bacterium]
MPDSKSIAKNVITLLLVLIVAFAGVYLGMRFRERQSSPPVMEQQFITKLTVSTPFPDVAVLSEDGVTNSTGQLLGGKPAVVLFLEFGCPPCKVMTAKWEQARTDEKLAELNLFGLTFSPQHEIRKYRLDNKLTFPVYADTGNVFMDRFEVTNYPYMVAINRTGAIVSHSFDANEEIDADELMRLLEK